MHTRLLISLFRPRGLLNYIMALLAVGILILLDTFATMYIATYMGAYLALALSALLMWVSLFLIWASLAQHIKQIRLAASQGLFPQLEFLHLAGLLIATFLVVLPGFVTDLFAWILYLPPFRLGLGAILFKRYEHEFTSVYEELQVNR